MSILREISPPYIDGFEIIDCVKQKAELENEIAGFRKEELLEVINFVKIGYYVCDYNHNNGKFGELQSRGYKIPSQLKEEGYKIVQFYNVNDDGKPYRHAGYIFIKDRKITIVYRGSRNYFDYITDARMNLISVLPNGGKIHSGFYSLFRDSWESVYKVLKGYANDQGLGIKDLEITLAGHSMGGAIANIAALCLSVTENMENFRVATFGSPRVFDSYAAEFYSERIGKNTIRVVNSSDIVPSLPFGSACYKHVGEQLKIGISAFGCDHQVDIYRNLILNIEQENFKSDNSISSYYYLSYVFAAFYNVLTVPSYLISSFYAKDEEQYFKQLQNKHKSASFSKMTGSFDGQIYETDETILCTANTPYIELKFINHLIAKLLQVNCYGSTSKQKELRIFINNVRLCDQSKIGLQNNTVGENSIANSIGGRNLTFSFGNEDLAKRFKFNSVDTLKTQQKTIYASQDFVTSTSMKIKGSMFSGSSGLVKPFITSNYLLPGQSTKTQSVMQEDSLILKDIRTERFASLRIKDDSFAGIKYTAGLENFTDWRESRKNIDYDSQSALVSIEEDLDISVQFEDENKDVDCLAGKLANSFKEQQKNNDSLLKSPDIASPSAPKQLDNSLQDDDGYHSSTHSSSITEEELQENNKLYSNEQKIKDLPQIMEVENQSQKQEQYKSKKSHIFSCAAGGCIGLAVAYFAGAAALTSVYVATGVFVGMVLAGALLGYSIAKLYDKVGTKVEGSCVAECSVRELAI